MGEGWIDSHGMVRIVFELYRESRTIIASHKRLFFGDIDERYRPSPEYEGGKSTLLTVSVSYDFEPVLGSE